uniref:Uncharacterized protein n=1 Tax=Plectus sambesii TaxID=2011161 RepID=A0A914W3D1_9BILA
MRIQPNVLVYITFLIFIFEYCAAIAVERKVESSGRGLNHDVRKSRKGHAQSVDAAKKPNALAKDEKVPDNPSKSEAKLPLAVTTRIQRILPFLIDGKKRSKKELDAIINAIFDSKFDKGQVEDGKFGGNRTLFTRALVSRIIAHQATKASDQKKHFRENGIFPDALKQRHLLRIEEFSATTETSEITEATEILVPAPLSGRIRLFPDVPAAGREKIFEHLTTTQQTPIHEKARQKLLVGTRSVSVGGRKHTIDSAIPNELANGQAKGSAREKTGAIVNEGAVIQDSLSAFTGLLGSHGAADKKEPPIEVKEASKQRSVETNIQDIINELASIGTESEEEEDITDENFINCACLPLVTLDQSAHLNSALTAGSALVTLSVVSKCESSAMITCTVAKGQPPMLRFRFDESAAGKNIAGDVGGEAVEDVVCNRETRQWQRTKLNTTFDEYACFVNDDDETPDESHESSVSTQATTINTATFTESETTSQGTTEAISSSRTVSTTTNSTCSCLSFDELEDNPKTAGVVAGTSTVKQSNDANGCPSSALLSCTAPDGHIPKILLVREGDQSGQSIVPGKLKNAANQEFKCLDNGHWQSKETDEKIGSFGCFYACPCPTLGILEVPSTDRTRTPGNTEMFNNTVDGCESLAIITCAARAGRIPQLSFMLNGEEADENTLGSKEQSALEPVNCNTQTGLWQRSGKNKRPFNQFSCFSTENEKSLTKDIPNTDNISAQSDQAVTVASLTEAKVTSFANKSKGCVPFSSLSSILKNPSWNAGSYTTMPLYQSDGSSSSPSAIRLTCSAPAGFSPQLMLIRNGQDANKKIINAKVERQVSEKFSCTDGIWSSRKFGNIDSFACFFACPCSPLSSVNKPGSEEEMMRVGEVNVQASASFGCEKDAVIRCSVAEGQLPVLSYRLQGDTVGENIVGFVKDVEDSATCDSATGTWMRTFDNNSAFSEFSCFAQREENATTSTSPLTTSSASAATTTGEVALPAVCLKDQSAITYTLIKVTQFPERSKTVTLYEIRFKNNGATNICGGKLIYYIDLKDDTVRDGYNLLPIGSFEVFPPRFVISKGMYKTPDFMDIVAGESRQGDIGLHISQSEGNSSNTPTVCTVSLSDGNC